MMDSEKRSRSAAGDALRPKEVLRVNTPPGPTSAPTARRQGVIEIYLHFNR